MKLVDEKLLKARKLLLFITDVLNENNIEYHLEGGTLLGIVRDGDLLPWDDDIDISIDISEAPKLKALQKVFWKKGLKLSIRKSEKSFGPIKKGQIRIFKVKPMAFNLWNLFDRNYSKRAMVADILVKCSDNTHTYWQAKDNFLRVSNIHYKGFETVEYMGHSYKAPLQFKEYLTAKYGDWSIQVKEWNCKYDEKTICD